MSAQSTNLQVANIPTNANALTNNYNPTSNLSAATLAGNAFGENNAVQYNQNKYLMGLANQFNNYQSSTAYQRTVKDMQAAGINPTVAFGLGKGQLDSSLSSAQASTWSNSGKLGGSIMGALGSMLKLLAFI